MIQPLKQHVLYYKVHILWPFGIWSIFQLERDVLKYLIECLSTTGDGIFVSFNKCFSQNILHSLQRVK